MILHFTRRELALATGTRRRETIKDNDYDKNFENLFKLFKGTIWDFSRLNVTNVHAKDKSKYLNYFDLLKTLTPALFYY